MISLLYEKGICLGQYSGNTVQAWYIINKTLNAYVEFKRI